MAFLPVEELLARSKKAWIAKSRWDGLTTECYRYAAPGMAPWSDSMSMVEGEYSQTAGEPQHDDLFDGTMARAAMRHANRLHAEAFPAGHDWGQLVEGPAFSEGERSTTKRRLLVEQIQRSIFGAIHASDFYQASGQMVFDGVVSGTGLMRVGISPDPTQLIGFEAVSQRSVALEGGPRAQVWGYYRKMRLLPREIASLWPQAKPVPVREKGDEERRRMVHDCVYYDPVPGVWNYQVIVEDEEPIELVKEMLLVCPWVCWRYSLLAGEVQGRSPVMAGLPDARTADHAVRIRLEAASLRALGMYMFRDDGVFNPRTVTMQSGAMVQVGTNDPTNPSIAPWPLAGDIQLNELVLEDLRDAINKTLLNQALPPATGAVRSATEIIERQKEAMLALGGPFLRLVEEVGRPVLRATAYQLVKTGKLPELEAVSTPDEETGEIMPLMLDGTDIAVKFISPLTKAQALSDAETIVGWAEATQRAVQMSPEAWISGAKLEDFAEALNEKMGAPPELVRDKEERAAQLQAAREAQGPAGAAPGGEGMGLAA